jgi:glyoxylase-like metal-dependent hydrolase (beta-lactamase superfamily II)
MNLHILRVDFRFNDTEDALYPVLLHDDRHLVLVDCGYPGFMPLLEAAARQQGFSLGDLTGILITHHDLDHLGGLYELKARYPQAKIYASAIEEKYISGKEKSLRLQQAEFLYPSLPDEQKAGALHFQEMLRNVQPVAVDRTFGGDEELPWLPGVRIVNTPGHMPGHVSIYLEARKTMIAADAVVYEHGALDIANPHYTLNLPEAVASVNKIRHFAIDTMICYHGGVVKGDIGQQLNDLIRRYAAQ